MVYTLQSMFSNYSSERYRKVASCSCQLLQLCGVFIRLWFVRRAFVCYIVISRCLYDTRTQWAELATLFVQQTRAHKLASCILYKMEGAWLLFVWLLSSGVLHVCVLCADLGCLQFLSKWGAIRTRHIVERHKKTLTLRKSLSPSA